MEGHKQVVGKEIWVNPWVISHTEFFIGSVNYGNLLRCFSKSKSFCIGIYVFALLL